MSFVNLMNEDVTKLTEDEVQLLWEKAKELSEKDKLKIIYSHQRDVLLHRILEAFVPLKEQTDEAKENINIWILNSLMESDCEEILNNVSTADLHENRKLLNL